jgi:hypothetical protein
MNAQKPEKKADYVDMYLLSAAFCVFMALLSWVVWFAHKDATTLRAECEARDGILISSRNELYTCVGKPPSDER